MWRDLLSVNTHIWIIHDDQMCQTKVKLESTNNHILKIHEKQKYTILGTETMNKMLSRVCQIRFCPIWIFWLQTFYWREQLLLHLDPVVSPLKLKYFFSLKIWVKRCQINQLDELIPEMWKYFHIFMFLGYFRAKNSHFLNFGHFFLQFLPPRAPKSLIF